MVYQLSVVIFVNFCLIGKKLIYQYNCTRHLNNYLSIKYRPKVVAVHKRVHERNKNANTLNEVERTIIKLINLSVFLSHRSRRLALRDCCTANRQTFLQ